MISRLVSSGALLAASLLAGPAVATSEFGDIPVVTAVLNSALEYERNGVEIPWSNPETGNSGVVAVERTFYLDPQSPCRDYRRTTERAGAPPAVVLGTGCRTPDGHWRLDERRDREPEPPAATVETEPLPPHETTAEAEEPTPLWTEIPEEPDEATAPEAKPVPRTSSTPSAAPARAAELPPLPRAKPTPPEVVVTASLPSKSDE